MKHPLSMLCAYMMLGALVVFGLAGWFLPMQGQLPAGWAPALGAVKVAAILAGACAFVAAAVASMRSAFHAEKALRAGRGFRHVFWLAIAYTGFCVAIEVSIGEVGARAVGLPLPHWSIVTGIAIGFAIAPRLVSWMLSALDGISKNDAKAARDDDHVKTIEELGARTELENARNGNVHHFRNTAAVGLIGAAAALAGAHGAVSEPPAQFPIETVSTGEEIDPATPSLALDRFAADPDMFGRKRQAKSWVRNTNQELFAATKDLVRDQGGIKPAAVRLALAPLMQELGINATRKTLRAWIMKARNELALEGHAGNAALLDA